MFSLLFSLSLSVERHRYRTCAQSPFCARNRHLPSQSWTVIDGSQSPTSFTAHLNDSSYSQLLQLNISFLSCGAVHFRISPHSPEPFPRFDLSREPTVVDQTALSSTAKFTFSDTPDSFLLKTAVKTVTIRKEPFAMFISDQNGFRISVNPDDTAVFETNRNRESHPDLFNPVDFGGHHDDIPNGPTSVALDFEFLSPHVRLTGLPAHTLPMTLSHTAGVSDPLRFFNTDINRFEIGNEMSMYGSVPFIFAHSPTGSDGLFWCNPSETWVDIARGETTKARFISEGGFIDFFTFSGQNSDIADTFTRLTGRCQLVPLFALGFHQCRWGYMTGEELRQVSADLDAVTVPHDVLWLDLDHTDDRRYFTFHPANFKNPGQLLDDLDANRRKLVVLVDPHLRVDQQYEVYAEALSRHLFIRTKDGAEDFVGNCWPGRSSWPDFLNPDARAWWETRFSFEKFPGSRSSLHIWNDMNEISVFDSVEGTAPRDLKHFGGIEEREVHNIYGHLMVSATFGGMVKRDNRRPFILTRSFFAGSQRYAAAWTGDNAADWSHLRNSVPLVLTFGLSSMVYSGADVGGFFDSPDPVLLSRWYQVGAWLYPFFRCHCHHESAHREVYKLEGEPREVARDAIVDRYRLINYWYTLARQANLTGVPIVRPLWWEFPEERFADVDDRAMLGAALLVVPFLQEGNDSMTVGLPEGRWYRWGSSLSEVAEEVVVEYDGGRTAVFLRGGKIVPMKRRIRKSSALMLFDPFVLVIGLDGNGRAEGELYVDDGESFEFTRGAFVHRYFGFDGKVLFGRSAVQGSVQKYDVRIEQIRIAGMKQPPRSIVDAKGTELQFEWEDQVLTVHRPQIPVSQDFTITFNF